MPRSQQRKAVVLIGARTVVLPLLLAVFCAYFARFILPNRGVIWYTNSVFPLFVAAACFFLFRYTASILDRTGRVVFSVVAVFFSLATVWGSRFDQLHPSIKDHVPLTSIGTWLSVLAMFFVFYALLFSLYKLWISYSSEELLEREPRIAKMRAGMGRFIGSWKSWVLVALVVLVIWTIFQVALYPGIFVYDVNFQFYQYTTDAVTAFHPPLHTYLIGSIISLGRSLFGSYNAGIFLFIFLQSLVLLAVFMWVLRVLYAETKSVLLVLVSWVFYALFPYVITLVHCATKDVLFAAFVMLFFLEVRMLLTNKSTYLSNPWHMVRFSLVTLLMLFFRNNAVYAMAFFLPFFAFSMRKRWLKPSLILISAMAIYLIVSGPVFTALGIPKGPVQEMLSIPFQQVGRVYNLERGYFETHDVSDILAYTKDSIYQKRRERHLGLERYALKLSDPIKTTTFKAIQGPEKFLAGWAKLGAEYPGLYLDAFLQQTIDLWAPNSIIDAYWDAYPGDPYSVPRTSYFLSWTVLDPGREVDPPILPGLRAHYLKMWNELSFQKKPIISLALSVSAWVWVLVVVIAFNITRKSKRNYVPLIFAGALVLTSLLGPAILVRYFTYLYFAFPLLFAAFLPSAGMGGTSSGHHSQAKDRRTGSRYSRRRGRN